MSRKRETIILSADERFDMVRFFIVISGLKREGKAQIDLVKLRQAYPFIDLKLKII